MSGVRRLRPRILEAYVAREFLKIFFLSLLAFLSIFLVVDFFEKIDRMVRAGLRLGDMGRYVFLKVPFGLEQVLAPSVLLAVVLTFGLLARSRETMAIRTSGLNILSLTRPVLILTVLAGAGLLALNLYLVPWSQARLNAFWDLRVMKKPPRSLMNLEHFWYKGERAIYNITLFRKDQQILEGVKLYRFDEEFRLVQVVAARQAVWREGRWHFLDGIIQNFGADPEGSEENFGERIVELREKPEDFGLLEKKISEMDWGDISSYVARLERDGYKSTPYRLELQTRLAMGLAPLALALLGLGLALWRGQVYIPALVAVSLVCMFAYWLVMGFANSLGQAGRWPLFAAVWLPHLLVIGGGLVLLGKATR
jgi:lipopolysaccharide export system permease protein